MVFGALAVADNPGQIPAQLRAELFGRVRGAVHPLGGIEPGLDALGELHLVLGVEQRDLADLLEIRPDRISRGGGLGVLAGLAQRLGFFLVPDNTPRARIPGRLRVLAVHRDLLDLDGPRPPGAVASSPGGIRRLQTHACRTIAESRAGHIELSWVGGTNRRHVGVPIPASTKAASW
jgi:hypothetical protein